MTTVAEIEVLVNMDSRQVVAGMDTIKRKTAEMGQHHEYTLSNMRRGWHDLRRTWVDVVSAVGLVSGAVGIAMIAVNALSDAFANTAKTAKESLDEIKDNIKDVQRELGEVQGRGKTYAQEAAIIGAKYKPGTKEYKEAMLGLQEKTAAEAFTKYGDTAALGEISAIEGQRRKLLPLQQQYDLAHAGGTGGADSYAYGISPAYQKAAEEKGIWGAKSRLMNLQALQGTFGTDFWSGEAVRRTQIPGAPGVSTAAPQQMGSLEEIKKHLDTLAKEPKKVDVNVTIERLYSAEAPQVISSKIAEAMAAGVSTSNIKAR